jgi:hypothetical protein
MGHQDSIKFSQVCNDQKHGPWPEDGKKPVADIFNSINNPFLPSFVNSCDVKA